MCGFGIYQKKYVESLEKELDYYRSFAERERARADRLHDQLLQQVGCLPATETAIKAQEQAEKRLKEAANAQTVMLTELYADAVDEHADTISAVTDNESLDTETLGAEIRTMLGR